jgi:hypothetical protein
MTPTIFHRVVPHQSRQHPWKAEVFVSFRPHDEVVLDVDPVTEEATFDYRPEERVATLFARTLPLAQATAIRWSRVPMFCAA